MNVWNGNTHQSRSHRSTVGAARWQMQRKLNRLGHCSHTLLSTLLRWPTITLADSDAYTTTFFQGISCFCSTPARASMGVSPVAMLHTGQSKKWSTTFWWLSSHSLTMTPKYFFSKLSFPLLQRIVNGCVWQAVTRVFSSGPKGMCNKSCHFHVSTRKGIRYFAVQKQLHEMICWSKQQVMLSNKASEVYPSLKYLVLEGRLLKNWRVGRRAISSSRKDCLALLQWCLTSCTPAPAMEIIDVANSAECKGRPLPTGCHPKLAPVCLPLTSNVAVMLFFFLEGVTKTSPR